MRRPTGLFAGLLAAAVSLVGSPSAQATTGLADGSISTSDTDCPYTGASTTDVPPNTLTIDHTTVHLTCAGDPAFFNDPVVTFDDVDGTVTIVELDVGRTELGVTCVYKGTTLVLHRKDTSREYGGGPFTFTLVSGGFLCPSSMGISVTIAFH